MNGLDYADDFETPNPFADLSGGHSISSIERGGCIDSVGIVFDEQEQGPSIHVPPPRPHPLAESPLQSDRLTTPVNDPEEASKLGVAWAHADGFEAGSESSERGADEVEENENGSETSDGLLVHTVTPNDSLAGVALRYNVSIAALRRANHLWPSDPIHLRTHLYIPKDGAPIPKLSSSNVASQNTSSHDLTQSQNGSIFSSPSHLISHTSSSASPFSSILTARDAILSALPPRLSLDSLSSNSSQRTSFSEERELGHELADLALPNAGSTMTLTDHRSGHTSSVETGLASPRRRMDKDHSRPIPRYFISPYLEANGREREANGRAFPFPDDTKERRPRRKSQDTLNTASYPVTSQLAPQPAMSLPSRKSD